MTETKHTFTAHPFIAAGLLTSAMLLIAQPGSDDDHGDVHADNDALVVANMTADLRDFGMCSQQARLLADQTADFGVLGLMTTVAAVGMRTEPQTPATRTVLADSDAAERAALLTGTN
ncbi:MAG: hypothetical protein QNJ91_10150 [Gammaproteobacteria bacterium]|nr:hypothetical protein [Gammaproteobacteria bacterium]